MYSAPIMPEGTNRPPRDIQQIAAEEMQTRQLLGEIMEKLRPGIEHPSVIGLHGKFFFGSERKTITKEDGSTEEVPWTMEDIMTGRDRMEKEGEASFRADLARDINTVVDAQQDFFRNKNKGKGKNIFLKDSTEVTDLTKVLLERVVTAPGKVTERYSDMSEDKHVSETLGVLRDVVLGPTFVEKQPKRFTKEIWLDVVSQEKRLLVDYMKQSARRSQLTAAREANLASQLVNGGEKIFSEEVITSAMLWAQAMMYISESIHEIESFDDLMPWIKYTFGKDATFQTFLEATHPQNRALGALT